MKRVIKLRGAEQFAYNNKHKVWSEIMTANIRRMCYISFSRLLVFIHSELL